LSALSRIKLRRSDAGPRPGMVRAEDLPRERRGASVDARPAPPPQDRDLLARRERLAERLTAIQLELGGLFYEMAIRDHVQMDVLLGRAAELQRVDGELAHVDSLLESGRGGAAGACPSCQAPYARGAAFCWQCGAAFGEGA
jgi:hypothetical protein